MDIDFATYWPYGFVLLGYLLGSIPFGMLLAYLGGYGDIREIGSGNIGATNVLRTGNKILAFITLICDSGKGAAAALLTAYFIDHQVIILLSAAAAILGHMYPVWLKFQGGKGVATTLGTILAISFPLGATMCGIWLLSAFTLRISSLSALTAFAAAPPLAYLWLENEKLAIFCAFVTIVVFWRHKENIKRLLKGEESKISFRKK